MEDTTQNEETYFRHVDVNGRPSWPYEDWKYEEDVSTSRRHNDSPENRESSYSEQCQMKTNIDVMSDDVLLFDAESENSLRYHDNAMSVDGALKRGVKRKKSAGENLEVHDVPENNPTENCYGYPDQIEAVGGRKSDCQDNVDIDARRHYNTPTTSISNKGETETEENVKNPIESTNVMDTGVPENNVVLNSSDCKENIEPTRIRHPAEGNVYTGNCDYEPDHWTDDLSEDLDKTTPLQQLIEYMEPLVNVNMDTAKHVADAMTDMMLSTAEEIKQHYAVFKDCTVIPVGSMMENTKIGTADEFDFAISLPYFGNIENVLKVVYMKEEDEMITDPGMKAIAKDLSNAQEGDTIPIINNLQDTLKAIWSNFMTNNIPPGWELSGSCHRDEISIAGTFHFSRQDDEFTVDVDVCFWTPIHESVLNKTYDKLESREYILNNCLDEQQKVFGIIPTDHGINFLLNTVRFAMSFDERKMLNKFGVSNGRIKCYKLAKAVAKLFFPKAFKREICKRCVDSLVSSFCLKNIVLFMIQNHPCDELWKDSQLGNRLLEVFRVLNFCMLVNGGNVSAFFTPYSIVGPHAWKHDPKNNSATDEIAGWEEEIDSDHLLLPDLRDMIEHFKKDLTSCRILQNYNDFMQNTEWNGASLIDRLCETLSALRENDEGEREMIANNPGGTCLQVLARTVSVQY